MSKRILAILFFISAYNVFAIELNDEHKRTTARSGSDSIQTGIEYLKQLTDKPGPWHFTNQEAKQSIRGLIHLIEDAPTDSIFARIKSLQGDSLLIYRNWQDVSDTLQIPGYLPFNQITEKKMQLDRAVRDQNPLESIPVPESILLNIEQKVSFIPKEKTNILLDRRLVTLPDSIKSLAAIKDTLKLNPKEYARYKRLSNAKKKILEQARVKYNDQLLSHYIDSVSNAYRNAALSQFSDSLQRHLNDSLKNQNFQLIQNWNNMAITKVNDSIRKILPALTQHARKIPQDIWLHNLSNDSIRVRLRNDDYYFTRLFLKNEQNDSLGVKIENLGRNSMKILIDDGVTFTRFREQQKKDIKFESFAPDQNLVKVQNRYNVITPWLIGSNSNIGITQTALSNWKKGGQSSLSILAVLRGYANYSDKKLKWENSVELRNGWIRLKNEDSNDIQKNDDKLELISRFGVSAFKKWYYSAEVDFETQFFRGYKYPDTDNPISAFMAPAKTLLKVGLDYKPSKNFSLFISPLTSKTVFVKDTALIDQTKFGIDKDKKRFWEPGLNTDLTFKAKVYENVNWETKYKMFINYRSPFKKFDVNWENIISMKLNDHINMNFMLHLIYDDNITFPTDKKDALGKTIYEAKWQVKELITVGFAYNINRRIYRRQEVKK